MAQQKVRIPIPKEYGPLEREAIAEKIIDRIIKRSQAGLDVDGNKFAAYSGKNKRKGKYSASYANSIDFKIAGKSTSKINLTLSESMLNAIEKLEDRSGSITVGIPSDDTLNNSKAEGNQKGTYGNRTAVTKGRRFLGISPSEMKAILAEFPIEKKPSLLERAAQIAASRRAARKIAEDVTEDVL